MVWCDIHVVKLRLEVLDEPPPHASQALLTNFQAHTNRISALSYRVPPHPRRLAVPPHARG